MARRGTAAHVAPSTRNAPPSEYANETWADWLRRQQNPKKPLTPSVLAITAAIAKKKDPEAGQGCEVSIPEGTN